MKTGDDDDDNDGSTLRNKYNNWNDENKNKNWKKHTKDMKTNNQQNVKFKKNLKKINTTAAAATAEEVI